MKSIVLHIHTGLEHNDGDGPPSGRFPDQAELGIWDFAGGRLRFAWKLGFGVLREKLNKDQTTSVL